MTLSKIPDAMVSGKPALATVATSGSYNDLSDKPAIPTMEVVPGAIYGLIPSAISGGSTTATVTISAGKCADSAGSAYLTKAAGMSWSVSNGNAINGYQGGSTLPNSSTIHFFICSGGAGTGCFASASLTPTLPAGYSTYHRRVFSLPTNSSGALLSGAAVEVGGGALDIWLAAVVADIAGVTLPTSSRTLFTVTGPSGVRFRHYGRGGANAGAGVLYTAPDEPDTAPTASYNSAPGWDQWGSAGNMSQVYVTTNTSAQIGLRASSAVTYYHYTRGWHDFRRQ